MSIRDDFFAAQAKASLWDVAVSIKRGNPLPLDANSVFKAYGTVNGEDYAGSLLEYATSNPVAYPGQICAVVGADATTIYYLDQNLAIQPVGIIPTGDNKTIEVTADGAISLLGAASAPNGTLPMIDAETGKLVWKTLEDIGAGDGNDNTTYEFSFANEKITIIPKFNGQPIMEDETQVKYELDLSTFVTADELNEAIKDFVTTDTLYSVAKDEKVLKLNDTVFSTELGLKHENGKISLTGIDGVVIAEFSDADFVKDSVLEDVNYNAETQEIVFTWKTVDGETKTDAVSVADFVQVYTAGNGIKIENNVVSADTTVVATKADLEDYYTADEVDTEFAKYTNTEALTELLKGKQDIIPANTYDAYGSAATAKSEAIAAAATDATTKADKALADAKADTAEQLKSYYTSTQVDNKLDLINTEIDTKQDKAPEGETYAYTSDIADAVTSLKNNEIKSAQNTADAAASAATNAQNTANAADAQASANKTAIEGHETRISAVETTVGGHVTSISELTGKVNALEGEDSEINAAIATINGEITTLKGEDGKLAGNIATINEELAKKALATDITAINQKIGSTDDTAEANTVYGAIAKAQAAATYDDTEVRGLITTETNRAKAAEEVNATAITNEATRADTAEKALDDAIKAEVERADAAEKVNAKAIADETTRAKAAEGANAEEIAKINAVLNTVSDSDDITSLKELAIWVENHGGDAAEMAAGIEANTKAIANIYTPASGEGEEAVAASGMLVDVDARVKTLEAVDHAAAHATTLQSAKDYAEDYADGLATNYATATQGAKADTAVQAVTSVAKNGITATRDENNNVVIDWDNTVTLILCGGGAN